MNRTVLTLMLTSWSLSFTTACDDAAQSPDAPSNVDDTGIEAPEESPEPLMTEHRCVSEGIFDFHMSGTGLNDFEGSTVWAAAVEPIESTQEADVTILLESTVQEGAFDLTCPQSLQEQYRYPSYVVVFDTDNSGDCSADDQFFLGQFYGWNDDVIAELNAASELEAVGDTTTWGNRSFCDYYVPSTMLD